MVSIVEKLGSRETEFTRKEASFKLEAFILGSDDDIEVYWAFRNWAPLAINGLISQKCGVKQDGFGVWSGTAEYGNQEDEKSDEKPQFGELTLNFETSGGKQKITQAPTRPLNRGINGPDAVAPSFKDGINVTDDSVDGVEIVVPALSIEVGVKTPGGKLTMSYMRTVAAITGTVNKEKFLDCDGGTLLFEGMTGSYKIGANLDRELKFKFSYSPNKTNIKVGDIVVPEKRGWEYLWTYYRKKVDAGASAVVMQPVACYVHTIYEETDFRTYLGWG